MAAHPDANDGHEVNDPVFQAPLLPDRTKYLYLESVAYHANYRFI